MRNDDYSLSMEEIQNPVINTKMPYSKLVDSIAKKIGFRST